jgi:hypothetical protein
LAGLYDVDLYPPVGLLVAGSPDRRTCPIAAVGLDADPDASIPAV